MANENFMKIRKGLNLNPTTLPPTGNVGDLVVDAADNKLKIWNGATWVIVGGLSDIADNNSTGNQPAVPSQNISIIRFTNNTPPTIQGIADGYNTKLLIISYVGLTGQMIIQNDSPSASAANRIITGTGGDISLNFGASLWLYYDGTSSRWRVVGGSATNSTLNNYTFPPGTVIPYAGDESTLGTFSGAWLPCDGRAVSRVTYANLFAAIGTRYGVGDGVSTFNLPDLRGIFIRGVDATSQGSTGRDPDAASRVPSGTGGVSGNQVGSYQSDAFKAHNHGYHGTGGSGSIVSHYAVESYFSSYAFTTSTTGGSETRPKNIAMLYIIKT
jgi:microcystin-dependent protein